MKELKEAKIVFGSSIYTTAYTIYKNSISSAFNTYLCMLDTYGLIIT